MPVKKAQKKNGAGESASAKPIAIVLAGLQLFTQYGYRKTSVDDIARAAQVAKRTVYLHFENKAAVFLAILEYLGDQVRQRCAAAERAGGTALDRLTGLLDAYFGMGFELSRESEHVPELEETFSKLARARIGDMNTEYEGRLARFLRSLQQTREIGGPPQGLTMEQIVHIVVRAAEGAKHDAKVQGDRRALERRLRELATLAIAAMKK
ncbi:MAG TPA: TetR/AcrR family transcriptional regulator [Candidatus Acidoferrales bacterium]|nr:TetR/AcrR family transcriptional regulator [Candidatus Acidoferrales bacterium]